MTFDNGSSKATSRIAPQGIEVNSRISDKDGFIGTVAYIGPVASAKNSNEIYVGIVWDDETRGNHDGSVICRRTNELIRHFSCKSSTGASFVRPSKLNYGVALDEDLVKQKYVESDAELVAPNNMFKHYARTSQGQKKPIEFLGELKIRTRQQISCLKQVSLRSMQISKAASFLSDVNSFAHLTHLDLAGNLLSNWSQVLKILYQFPDITWVSFASNKIRDVRNDSNFDSFTNLPGLSVLNLNNCAISSFDTIIFINRIMPNLSELCVVCNNLSDMDSFDNQDASATLHFSPFVNIFQNLTLLDCSKCNLSSWNSQIGRFRLLSNLEVLILDNNHIPFITSSTVSKNHDSDQEFPKLKTLLIAGNKIDSWSGLDALLHFPSLSSLRFRNNPVTQKMGAGEARSIIIARIPHLTFLNASPITQKERIESERRYIRFVAAQITSQNKSQILPDTLLFEAKKQGILNSHGRFEELLLKHKEYIMTMIQNQSSNTSQNSIASEVINVTISSMIASSCTSDPLYKRLPGSLTVGRLKILCARAFHIDSKEIVLHFKASADDPFPTELDDDQNTLSYYAVCDGAEILVHEISHHDQNIAK